MSSHRTTDHEKIRRWAEERGGWPACLQGSETKGSQGVLRISFREEPEELRRISWEDFFDEFDRQGLEFVFQERTSTGELSRYGELVVAMPGAWAAGGEQGLRK